MKSWAPRGCSRSGADPQFECAGDIEAVEFALDIVFEAAVLFLQEFVHNTGLLRVIFLQRFIEFFEGHAHGDERFLHRLVESLKLSRLLEHVNLELPPTSPRRL